MNRIRTDSEQMDSGFVALFFVLSFATALGVLVFSISLRSTHMLTLFKSMRDIHIAKSSAVYCLRALIYNKSINQGYRPVLGAVVSVSNDSYCVYESFSEIPKDGVFTTGVVRDLYTGIHSTSTAKVVRKFTVQVLGVKRVGNVDQSEVLQRDASHLQGISNPQDVQRRLQREYYITDSL